ncbi:MAG TPA: APC family permease [Gemmatimonadaceae bacterium]|nr:APC family permease [Gemmatimonadaceae bacterium]
MTSPTLVRAIGRWALTAIVINSVLGSGVFGLPSALAGFAGGWSPLTVLVAGASIFIIVLCFAEVGSRFDDSGGPYLYAREAFGPAAAFQVGWLHLWTRLFSAAAVINVLISYLASVMPWVGTSVGRTLTMTICFTIAAAINVSGIRQGSWMVNVFTVAKMLPLFAVIAFGALHFNSEIAASQPVDRPSWTEAVLILVFGYGGFESGVVAVGEARDPKRDTAFALLVAMLTITTIYCLIQLVVIGVLPNAKDHAAPITDTLRILLGQPGAVLGTIAVVISIYGWLLGFVLTVPRIVYSMSTRGELPSFFGRVHSRFRTPHVAIIGCAIAGLALGLSSGFTQLATFSAVSRLAIFASTCASLIVFRRRGGERARFRAPGGVVTALIGIAFCVWLLTTRNLAQAWPLIVVVTVGVMIWVTTSSRRASV